MKTAFHAVNVEDWLARIPEGHIRLFGFLMAVGPVLAVSGWFYFAGNSTGQSQSRYPTLPADAHTEQPVVSPQASAKAPATAGLSIPTVM